MEKCFDENVYILWYHKVFGSTKRGRKALEHYGGDYFEFYNALYEETDKTGLIEKMGKNVFKSYSPVDAQLLIEMCEDEFGWKVISCRSPEYPQELLETEDYPHILFCDGDISILNRSVKVAVVGSRDAKPQAEVFSRNAAYNLAKTGAVIVSGAALGIDSCAHLGAIEAGGETVGVLGCGLGSDYLDRLCDFYGQIKEHGVFITEMFPFQNATKYSFPERNRIIAGLSRSVLVTCAAERSGSLITAKLARKQGRRVYAAAPELCSSAGCKKLIENGSYLFYTAGDIAYPIKEFYPDGVFSEMYCNKPIVSTDDVFTEEMAIPKKKSSSKASSKKEKAVTEKVSEKSENPAKSAQEISEFLSDNAKLIYDLIGDSPIIIDDLVASSGLRINHVLIAVAELETEQLIETLPGNRIDKI